MPPTPPLSTSFHLNHTWEEEGRSDPTSIIAIHGLGTQSPRTWEFPAQGR